MSEIVLHANNANCLTCVSNFFIDNYMVAADGEYVKIYLYLLRCAGVSDMGLSIPHMAEILDHTQKDIKKALHYWERHGLLRLSYDSENDINGIFLLEPSESQETQEASDKASDAVSDTVSAHVVSGPDKDKSNDILYMAEKLLGYPITLETMSTILSWHDDLNLSWELVEYIIETCAENGNSHINYLNKTAINIANSGISTAEEARLASASHSSLVYAVKKAFGISGRNLADAELAFLDKWSVQYGFDDNIISTACGRTILKIQRASFEYTDTILTSWYEHGVKSLADIEKLDSTLKALGGSAKKQALSTKKVHNFPERDTDLINIQKKLLQV